MQGRRFEACILAARVPKEETPEAAAALLKREVVLWGDVIRDNNIVGQYDKRSPD